MIFENKWKKKRGYYLESRTRPMGGGVRYKRGEKEVNVLKVHYVHT